MAYNYMGQSVPSQLPQLQSSGYGTGAGSGYLGTMGMSPEYNDQLFSNIQQNINKNKQASRQNVLDNTSRFGQGGGQDQALMGVEQNAADQSVMARSTAEMKGAEMHRDDRNKYNDQRFMANENQQQRLLQQLLQENQLGQDAYQYNTNRNDAQFKQGMDTIFSFGGMMGGM